MAGPVVEEAMVWVTGYLAQDYPRSSLHYRCAAALLSATPGPRGFIASFCHSISSSSSTYNVHIYCTR